MWAGASLWTVAGQKGEGEWRKKCTVNLIFPRGWLVCLREALTVWLLPANADFISGPIMNLEASASFWSPLGGFFKMLEKLQHYSAKQQNVEGLQSAQPESCELPLKNLGLLDSRRCCFPAGFWLGLWITLSETSARIYSSRKRLGKCSCSWFQLKPRKTLLAWCSIVRRFGVGLCLWRWPEGHSFPSQPHLVHSFFEPCFLLRNGCCGKVW